jgi:uncharacterized BrkB/YihY/UPF0761 family membrane protein
MYKGTQFRLPTLSTRRPVDTTAVRPRSASTPAPVGLFDAGRRLARAMTAHDAFRSAAAVAFWLFLSLVPLLVLVGFLVGQVARRRGVEALIEPLLGVVPATAEGLVREEVQRLAGGDASIAPLGVLGYLWAASSGVHNLLDVFDRATSGRPRPYWRKRAVSLAWVVLGLVVACLVASCLVRIDDAAHRPAESSRPAHAAVGASSRTAPIAPSGTSERSARSHTAPTIPGPVSRSPRDPERSDLSPELPSSPPSLHRHARAKFARGRAAALTLLVGTALLACLYRFSVVHAPGERPRVWPGTVASVACWLGVSWAFGVYAASIAHYALFYGSLAAVAVLLVWLYLTSLSIILGVEINAMLERRRKVPPPPRAL